MSDVRRARRPRLMLPLVGLAGVFLAGCVEGTFTYNVWNLLWAMVIFMFWVMFIWIFIALFRDILTRSDLSGGGRALWVLVLFIFPFLGALIYLIARPKVVASDIEQMTKAEAAYSAVASVGIAEQIEKVQALKASGAITEAEYEKLKAKLIG